MYRKAVKGTLFYIVLAIERYISRNVSVKAGFANYLSTRLVDFKKVVLQYLQNKVLKDNWQSPSLPKPCDLYMARLLLLCRTASSLPLFKRLNSIGEIKCFLRRVILQNGSSLLTGAESRITLNCICGYHLRDI